VPAVDDVGWSADNRAHDDPEAYVPATIPPDPERDKRVAARRAADAARAGSALDSLLGKVQREADREYVQAWLAGYAASELHHKCHYGVPGWTDLTSDEQRAAVGLPGADEYVGDAWADAWPERCGSNLGPLRGTCDLQAGHDGPC
jgi:hypothetical protein